VLVRIQQQQDIIENSFSPFLSLDESSVVLPVSSKRVTKTTTTTTTTTTMTTTTTTTMTTTMTP
jgi:hypothetical protein